MLTREKLHLFVDLKSVCLSPIFLFICFIPEPLFTVTIVSLFLSPANSESDPPKLWPTKVILESFPSLIASFLTLFAIFFAFLNRLLFASKPTARERSDTISFTSDGFVPLKATIFLPPALVSFRTVVFSFVLFLSILNLPVSFFSES